MKHLVKIVPIAGLATLLALPLLQPTAAVARVDETRLSSQVRHEIVMLPRLTVFDNIEYAVRGATVTLSGEVTQPTLKADAKRAVKRIEGVNRVENHIEVLPVSSMDNRLRLILYRAIYDYPALSRYAMPVIAPIRIIVKNGDVTLAGIVDRKSDKNLAGILANSVPGVFSVTNHLRVAKPD